MTQEANLILLTNVKPDICATCGLCVISSVSNYILLEMHFPDPSLGCSFNNFGSIVKIIELVQYRLVIQCTCIVFAILARFTFGKIGNGRLFCMFKKLILY